MRGVVQQWSNPGTLEALLLSKDLERLLVQGIHALSVAHQGPHLMDDFQGRPIRHSSNGGLIKVDLLPECLQVRKINAKNTKYICGLHICNPICVNVR